MERKWPLNIVVWAAIEVALLALLVFVLVQYAAKAVTTPDAAASSKSPVVVAAIPKVAPTGEATPTLPVPSPTATRVSTLAATPRPAGAPAPPVATPTPTALVHKVEAGEVLGAIAERYGVSVKAIQAANALADLDTLAIGQEIVIPRAGAPSAPPATTPTANAGAAPSTPPPQVTHVVSQGETLLEIAGVYGVSAEDVARANGLLDRDSLAVGQRLAIPASTGGRPAAPAPSAPATQVVHTVKPGDSISSIAELYGVTSESIVRYNGVVDPDSLSIGQQLVIPR